MPGYVHSPRSLSLCDLGVITRPAQASSARSLGEFGASAQLGLLRTRAWALRVLCASSLWALRARRVLSASTQLGLPQACPWAPGAIPASSPCSLCELGTMSGQALQALVANSQIELWRTRICCFCALHAKSSRLRLFCKWRRTHSILGSISLDIPKALFKHRSTIWWLTVSKIKERFYHDSLTTIHNWRLYRVLLTVKCSRSIWSYPVHFQYIVACWYPAQLVHGDTLFPSRREAMSGPIVARPSPSCRVCPSGCLGVCRLVVRSPPSLSSSLGPLFLGLPQSSLPTGTPLFPLLLSVLQRCFRSAAGQRFRSLLVGYRTFRPPTIQAARCGGRSGRAYRYEPKRLAYRKAEGAEPTVKAPTRMPPVGRTSWANRDAGVTCWGAGSVNYFVYI